MYHTHHPPRNFTLQGPKKETHTHTQAQSQQKKGNNKDQTNSREDQQNKTQFFEEVKQDWQSLSRTNQGEKKDPE